MKKMKRREKKTDNEMKTLLDTFEQNILLIKEQVKAINGNLNHLFWDFCTIKQTYYKSIGEAFIIPQEYLEEVMS